MVNTEIIMLTNGVYAIVYSLVYHFICKLTKNLPIQGSCWIFRIQGGGFVKGKGKTPGVQTSDPVGARL